jgi:acyl-CoA thioesterase
VTEHLDSPSWMFRTATEVAGPDFPAEDADAAGKRAVWSGAIAPGWDIATNANGGYLMAIVARALGAALDRPDPVTISAHYFYPGKPGDVTIETRVLKQGRSFSSGTAVLLSGGRALLSCIGTFGDLAKASGPEIIDQGPPVMPDPDDCLPVVATDTFPPPFMGKIELRLHPEDGQFLLGKRTGQALMRGWFRLRNDEPADTIALLCAVDAFPPTAFNADLPVAWTPTIELTVHVRARPEPGWLRCKFATHFVTGGFLEEDGEIWDATGRLVAQSRQLALVPRGQTSPAPQQPGR